jgi:hypothetical protein
MSQVSNSKILRLGAGAGYAGDRIPPAVALAEKGQLDYLVFECLAERTIALAQLEKLNKQVTTWLGDLVVRPTGQPKLVRDNAIQEDFK